MSIRSHLAAHGPGVPIKVSDLVCLINNFNKALKTKEVGDQHAHKSPIQQLQEMDRVITIPVAALENALYYCNMLNELGLFEHPQKNFKSFLQGVEKRARIEFDQVFNVAERAKDV